MARPPRYQKTEVIAALIKAKGLISLAARELGCAQNTIRKFIDKYPDVKQAIDDQRETVVDLAEAKLMEAISSGQPWAISMVLRTLGKKRGYVEKQEIDHGGRIAHDVSFESALDKIYGDGKTTTEE